MSRPMTEFVEDVKGRIEAARPQIETHCTETGQRVIGYDAEWASSNFENHSFVVYLDGGEAVVVWFDDDGAAVMEIKTAAELEIESGGMFRHPELQTAGC